MHNPRAQQYERWKTVHDSLTGFWQRGVLTENMSHVLEACAHGKVNIVVSGDNNSIRTELVNALSSCFEPDEITTTLGPDVTDRTLISDAIQAGVARIIVDECASIDGVELLRAMSNGCRGSVIVLSANSPDECLQQLESLLRSSDSTLSPDAARELIAKAIELVIQTGTTSDGANRVTEIVEVGELDGPVYSLHKMFHFDPHVQQHCGSTQFPRLLQQLEDEVIPFKLMWLR
jgi:pilus assembly protein CpaF